MKSYQPPPYKMMQVCNRSKRLAVDRLWKIPGQIDNTRKFFYRKNHYSSRHLRLLLSVIHQSALINIRRLIAYRDLCRQHFYGIHDNIL